MKFGVWHSGRLHVKGGEIWKRATLVGYKMLLRTNRSAARRRASLDVRHLIFRLAGQVLTTPDGPN